MNRQKIFKKILAVVAAIAVVIGVSFGVATFVHRGDSVPASTTVKNGLSAYELAVQSGYSGTVQEWLASLSGKSAYEIAVDAGYEGSEAEWTSALNTLAQSDIVGIKTASFNSQGQLVLTLSDDTTLNLGNAIGADGKDGADGQDGADGKVGADGQDGADDQDGADGISITDVDINEDGELVLTFSDTQSVNVGKVVGASGINGQDGADGKDGADGADGEDGLTPFVGDNGNWWIGTTDTGVKAAGTDGKDGVDGKNGDSITNISITDRTMTIILSNGKDFTFENIVPKDGLSPTIGANGNWWIGETDTGAKAAGTDGTDGADGADGAQGPKGDQGEQGEPGRGIANVEIIDGCLWITYTDDLDNPVNVGQMTAKDEITNEITYLTYTELDDGTYSVALNDTYLKSVISIVIPAEYNGKAVTQIASSAFSSATALQRISIPDSVTAIGSGAFSGCSALTSIEIPDSIATIEQYVFKGCTQLKTITIPQSVKLIRIGAFTDSGLTEAVFDDPNGWESYLKRSANYATSPVYNTAALSSETVSDPATMAEKLTAPSTAISGYAVWPEFEKAEN